MRLLLLLALGCGGGAAGTDAAAGRWCEATLDLPLAPPTPLDLLLVIDRSPSMAEEQAWLPDGYRSLGALLERIEEALIDAHIGVVAADLADGGRLAAFLAEQRRPDGSRTVNYEGTLGDALAAAADLGAAGAPISAPLAAARGALDGSNPANVGFLRPDAFLAVVFVTDEDDCSATVEPADPFTCTAEGVQCDGGPVGREPAEYGSCAPRADGAVDDPARFVDFFRTLKDDPYMMLVAAVSGPPSPFAVGPGPALLPSCASAAGSAAPAVRLAWFLDQFPRRGSLSICDGDLAGVLGFLQPLEPLRGVPCLDPAVDATDVDAAAPGLQIDCSVTLGHPTDLAPGWEEIVLPRCSLELDGRPSDGQPRPCWWVERAPESCSGAGLGLRFELAVYPTIGTHLIARCATRC